MKTKHAVLVLWWAVGGQVAARDDATDGIVKQLRHNERLVRSMACEMDVKTLPTSATALAQLKRAAGQDTSMVARYTVTGPMVELGSYTAKWWRDGQKERLEVRPLGSPATQPHNSIKVFDGNIVRSLHERGSDGKPAAVIETFEKSAWKTQAHITPFSLLFEYDGVPCSDLLARSKTVSLSRAADGSGATQTVTFLHPDASHVTIRLTLDSRGVVVERGILWSLDSNKPHEEREVHKFQEYGAYPDPSGETIWFPKKVSSNYFTGRLKDGHKVLYKTVEVSIRGAEYNPRLADSLFKLSLPAGAVVDDRVTGLGILPAAEAPAFWTNPPASSRSDRVLGAALAVGVFAAAVGIVLGVRQRRRAIARRASG
ncbi:MAG: hypothetical protein U0871_04535 [Gemmataceae bacterium]